jgi:2-oxoisovalerate ferredoxin oxidoreductase beta subunit
LAVCISGFRRPIGSPVVDHPDVLVAFNRLTLEKIVSTVRKRRVILYDYY